MLTPGTAAPDFLLDASHDSKISLSNYKGRRVILAFYPADWSPVCGDQLSLYNEIIEMFEGWNTQLIGISVDSKWSHASFREQRNLGFPLLADFQPKGQVSQAYGVYNEQMGESERALFVIDENMMIRWSYLSDRDVNPGVDGLLQEVEKLETIK